MQKVCIQNKVVVNLATINDLMVVYSLVDDYSDGINIDRDRTKLAIRDIIYIDGVLLVEYNSVVIGGIAGYIMPSMFTNDTFFMVMFFYVRKGYRHLTKSIIKELELVVLPSKITKLIFGVLNNDRYAQQKRYFKMLGYKELETHMWKDV